MDKHTESDKYTLEIHADGSSTQSPRRGGNGYKFIFVGDNGNEITELYSGSSYLGATSNEMELQACISALDEAIDHDLHEKVTKISIYTDSMYVVGNYKKAMFQWPKQKWAGHGGAYILNVDLWKDFIKRIKRLTSFGIWFNGILWEKGHSSNQHNKDAHNLAKQSVMIPSKKRISSYVSVRRKNTPYNDKNSCIKMKGQQVKIKIFTTKYLAPHRIWRYKYKIVSPDNEYYQHTGYVHYKRCLRTSPVYLVQLNDNDHKPTIAKVLKETKQ
jgi:ribonuclease HI